MVVPISAGIEIRIKVVVLSFEAIGKIKKNERKGNDMVIMFLIAMAPIIWLIIALSGLKMPGYKACFIGLILTILLAAFVWKQPAMEIFTGALEGIAMAIWPICYVIIAAVFAYNVTVHTKKMELIKRMLTSVSKDQRILVLIIAFGFGSFMEGMAGFGTAVAIPASMLVGLGMNPVIAAATCLVANTAPTAYGSIGIPTTTLASVAQVDAQPLGETTAILLIPILLVTPFLLVCMTGKSIKALKGMGVISLVCGVSFALPFYGTAHFMGPELPTILSSVICMIATGIAVKFIHKGENQEYELDVEEQEAEKEKMTIGEMFIAWLPFLFILVLLMAISLIKPLNQLLVKVHTTVPIYSGEGASPYTFTWIATPGTMILIAAFLGGLIQGASIKELFQVLLATIKQMWKTIVTIVSVLATAKIMGYSGMISDIATLFVTVTRAFYPIFAPFLGSIVTFVSGSATTASVLFGGLQAETATAIGMSPVWLAAANTGGAVVAKMISPQNISIGAAAADMQGQESTLMKIVIKYYIVYIILLGLLSLLFCRVLTLGF